jgi:ubiquinone/menaquinone biosynthesis C-methylase UbiE
MAKHVCPYWIGYLLANPLRKIWQNPRKILQPFVKPGMRVLDIGCAMGFFSLPMAEMVGVKGRVICVDLQEKMLERLIQRAKNAGLDHRIETRKCEPHTLGIADLSGSIDFILALAVIHELPESKRFFDEVRHVLIPGGKLLIAEPKGHVTKDAFEEMLILAEKKDFQRAKELKIWGSRAFLLTKRD